MQFFFWLKFVQILSSAFLSSLSSIFWSHSIYPFSGRYIYLEDLMCFMEEDEAVKTMSLFEGAAENRRISKSSLKNWVVSFMCLVLLDSEPNPVRFGLVILVAWLINLEFQNRKTRKGEYKNFCSPSLRNLTAWNHRHWKISCMNMNITAYKTFMLWCLIPLCLQKMPELVFISLIMCCLFVPGLCLQRTQSTCFDTEWH